MALLSLNCEGCGVKLANDDRGAGSLLCNACFMEAVGSDSEGVYDTPEGAVTLMDDLEYAEAVAEQEWDDGVRALEDC